MTNSKSKVEWNILLVTNYSACIQKHSAPHGKAICLPDGWKLYAYHNDPRFILHIRLQSKILPHRPINGVHRPINVGSVNTLELILRDHPILFNLAGVR